MIVIESGFESALAPPASATWKTRRIQVPSTLGVPLISPL